jgi:hypothetical protein
VSRSVALWIDPFSHHQYWEQDRLFRPHTGPPFADDYAAPWRHVRAVVEARGVPVHTADLLDRRTIPGAEVNIYVSLGLRTRYRRLARRADVVPSAFFAFECPVVEPRLYRALPDAGRTFRRLFSYSTEAALRPFVDGLPPLLPFRLPQAYDRVHAGIWQQREREFLVMINANKVPRLYLNELYSERRKAVTFFGQHGEIDLYGIGWDGPSFRMGETAVPGPLKRLSHRTRILGDRIVGPRDPDLVAARAVYRGPATTKAEILGRYTFSLCFENMVLEGWVTEKLFDSLLAGNIPVYRGAPDIERWVPKECFIDMRDFDGYGELREFLHSLRPADVDRYREAGRAYLESDGFRPFTSSALAEIFLELLAEDAGLAV